MKNILVIVALPGLAITAITNSAWSWLVAVIAISVALYFVQYFAQYPRLPVRIQLVLIAALGGGLGSEIAPTLYFVAAGALNHTAMYRQVLIASLESAIIVLAAMIAGFLLQKLGGPRGKQS